VWVKVGLEGQHARIDVIDNGAGMDAKFVRERLFKPFDSTKGLSGMGIGAYECREFIRALGGRVEVASKPGEGTRFSMIVPLAERPVAGSNLKPGGESDLPVGIQ
jgi:signal transduction histidine kinase